MGSKFSRRDFLKLALSLPLVKFSASSAAQALSTHSTISKPANVLIMVYDTLSALHLPFHGYPRQTTPNLARLANRALVYHANYSAGNFTTPGTASLFTGSYPWSHRALHLYGTPLEIYKKRNFFQLTPPDYYRTGYSHNLLVTILMHQLRANFEELKYTRDLALLDLQYSDLVFQKDYYASFWGESSILRSGATKPSSLFLAQLFRVFEFLKERELEKSHGNQFPQGIPHNNQVYFTLEKGIDWCIDQLHRLPQPYVAYMHFLPPHNPYFTHKDHIHQFNDDFIPVKKPRHRFSEKSNTGKYLKQRRKEYDEYLAYADSEFGRLYDHLEKNGQLENGQLDNTYLIFTSDHGELFERGIMGHITPTLYEPLIRVPLLISKPGQTEREDIYSLTSGVDLLPTLSHIMGQTIPGWCEGQILPGFTEEISQDEREIFVIEAKKNPQFAPLTIGTFAMIKGSHKLIHYRGYGDFHGDRDELYNLANDPDELDNRYQVDTELAKGLKEELVAKIDQADRPFNK